MAAYAAQASPTVSNRTPTPGSTVPAGVETTIAARLDSVEAITSLSVFLNGIPIDVEIGGQSETQQAFFTSRVLAAGEYQVRVVVRDQGGNNTDLSWTFRAQAAATATPTPVRPTISNLTPAPDTSIPAGRETTVAANFVSDEPFRLIEVLLDGASIDVEVVGPSERQQSFFTGRTFTAGRHTVRLIVEDASGDRDEATWSFTALAPTPTPEVPVVKPTISRLTPTPDSSVRAGREVTIAANVVSDEAITGIEVYLNGQPIDVEIGGQSESRQAFFTGRTLAAGNHKVRVVARDSGGQATDVSWSFDAAAPTARPPEPTATPVATATATSVSRTPTAAPTNAATRTVAGPTGTATPQATSTAMPQTATSTPTNTHTPVTSPTAIPTTESPAPGEPPWGTIAVGLGALALTTLIGLGLRGRL
ncbi:MAG: Ig-like domain-containing protein [Chloroflexota bacterium]